MMEKHTKGPWNTFEYQCRSVIGVARQGDDSFTICEVNPDLESEQGYQIAEANARLIAAAPDLLEACRLAVDAYAQGPDPRAVRFAMDSAIDYIRTAIAKATQA
jgi:hypothetical protein